VTLQLALGEKQTLESDRERLQKINLQLQGNLRDDQELLARKESEYNQLNQA